MTNSSGEAQGPKFITAGTGGHPFNIFWQPAQPDRIHMATNDPTFTDQDQLRPGIRVVFSSNPRSADYNPATFNRLARALASAGAAAPPEAPVHRRHLRDRDALIKALSAVEVPEDELPESSQD